MRPTIEKVCFKVSVKTDGGFYPRGSVLFAPFAADVMAEIEAGNTIEVLWDSSLAIDGEPLSAEKSSPSEVKERYPKVKKVSVLVDDKDQLEAYITMLDPALNFDRRKSVKTLRKQVKEMVLQKARDYGQVLDPLLGIDVLMREFSDLQAAEKAIEEDI